MGGQFRPELGGHFGRFFQYTVSTDEKKEFIQIIRKSGERLIDTVTDLVEISKLDSGLLSENAMPVNLESEFYDFFHDERAKFKDSAVQFYSSIAPELLEKTFSFDLHKVLKVLHILIGNAFKFTVNGSVEVSVIGEKNNLVFSVADTGIGIAPQYHKFVFKAFSQIEPGKGKLCEGIGLGLTIAKKLTKRMKGKIWFESEVAKGTTFYLSIPQKIVSANTKMNLSAQSSEQKNILIVEDDGAYYHLLENFLKTEGLGVTRAINGKEAIDLIKHNPVFDLIIMDSKMPVMNGTEAIQEILKITHQIPIVSHSAYTLHQEQEEILKKERISFLPKPANKEELLRVIWKQINEKTEIDKGIYTSPKVIVTKRI
ncbi:hybrid sensor histidine kinase/response regulator [Draconibacterium sp.]|uniref:hybrid sensor histidine kinase/response regulator n=1 Tax=Draconibacterium sp. TaxID=1965318 RepID=UPI00356AA549